MDAKILLDAFDSEESAKILNVLCDAPTWVYFHLEPEILVRLIDEFIAQEIDRGFPRISEATKARLINALHLRPLSEDERLQREIAKSIALYDERRRVNEIDDNWEFVLIGMLSLDKKVAAIKKLREITECGLREAVQIIRHHPKFRDIRPAISLNEA